MTAYVMYHKIRRPGFGGVARTLADFMRDLGVGGHLSFQTMLYVRSGNVNWTVIAHLERAFVAALA